MAKPPEQPTVKGFDAFPPPEMARRAEDICVAKGHLDFWSTAVLGVLAGAFIAFGAVFATVVWTGGSALPWGVSRLLGGLVFTVGLILVVVAGAELFTGNNLIVMAWAGGRVSTWQLLRNWAIVYAGNFAGSLATVLLVVLGGHYLMADGGVGQTALDIGLAKVRLGFVQALALGTLCNALVCLAVWMTYSARTTVDRILSVVPPIAAFVAAGFEHSVANMYFIPVALAIKSLAPPAFWDLIGKTPLDYADLTWPAFLLRNLVPVTLGNIFGGSVLVGAVYWVVYLRPKRPSA